jgi:hypothetical protein
VAGVKCPFSSFEEIMWIPPYVAQTCSIDLRAWTLGVPLPSQFPAIITAKLNIHHCQKKKFVSLEVFVGESLAATKLGEITLYDGEKFDIPGLTFPVGSIRASISFRENFVAINLHLESVVYSTPPLKIFEREITTSCSASYGAVGGVAGGIVLIGGAVFFCCRRRRRMRRDRMARGVGQSVKATPAPKTNEGDNTTA